MTANLSPAFRLAIYVIGSVGTLVTGYLFTKDILGREEVALWGGFVALGFGLAGINTPAGHRRNDHGEVDVLTIIAIVFVVLAILVVLGFVPVR